MITKEIEQALAEAKSITEKFSENQIHTIIGYLQYSVRASE
jgi:hypothetical protein